MISFYIYPVVFLYYIYIFNELINYLIKIKSPYINLKAKNNFVQLAPIASKCAAPYFQYYFLNSRSNLTLDRST